MIQYSTAIWSLPQQGLAAREQSAPAEGLSPGKECSEGEKEVGCEGPAWQCGSKQREFLLGVILVFLILGEYLIGSHGFKIQKTQKDIKRERFPSSFFNT